MARINTGLHRKICACVITVEHQKTQCSMFTFHFPCLAKCHTWEPLPSIFRVCPSINNAHSHLNLSGQVPGPIKFTNTVVRPVIRVKRFVLTERCISPVPLSGTKKCTTIYQRSGSSRDPSWGCDAFCHHLSSACELEYEVSVTIIAPKQGATHRPPRHSA
jgi:hypothetical protein